MSEAPKKLVIFGIEATARVAHYFFDTDSDFEVVAFTVNQQYIDSNEFMGLPLVPFEQITESHPPSEYLMYVAIGYSDMNRLRAAKYHEAKEMGYQLASYVSSRCTYLSENNVGDNTLIMEDNTIQPFVKIGNDVILWSGNHVGHDTIIEDHVFVASHAVISGFVRVCSYCFIGVNATLRDAITIAPETLIGAGAVITKDTEQADVFVPPRPVKLDKKSFELKIS